MAIVQISQITQRKGLQIDLPQLAGAEFGWSVDERRLYIGNGTLEEGAPVVGNTEILTEFSDILQFNTAYTYKGADAGYVVQTGPSPGDPVIQSLQSWLDQFATVKDFGAVGDGITDDTEAINRALYQLYCREINPQIRRSLFFPAGTYRVTETILIPPWAMLWGEGLDSSLIVLDAGIDSTLAPYVARTCDSLQQTGVNIGNNGAAAPQYITIKDLGFKNLNAGSDVFLVDDTVNSRFLNVLFAGPLTQLDLTTEVEFTAGVRFHSTASLVCEQIVFDGCIFTGTTYGTDSDQQIKGVTFTNGRFDTLYKGVNLGTNTPILGGPTGVQITHNVFDHIYAEGIVIGDISLNASGYNIFYDVGDHFGGIYTPYTACIDIQADNNVSIGDMFAREDAYANQSLPGTAYPRITLNNTVSIATTNGSETQQGTYSRESGQIITLDDDATGTIASFDSTQYRAISINYTIIRETAYRTGTIIFASSSSDSTGDLVYSDDYVENSQTGVNFSFTEAADVVTFSYTTTSTGLSASMSFSVTTLG